MVLKATILYMEIKVNNDFYLVNNSLDTIVEYHKKENESSIPNDGFLLIAYGIQY